MPPTSTSPRPAIYDIAGIISHHGSGLPVPGVDVYLLGQGERFTTTAASGTFEFSRVSTGKWTLEPRKQEPDRSAAGALDAVYVLQAFAGRRHFDPLQQLACDVDGNGRVDRRDAVHILELRVGLSSQLPVASLCASDWAFAPLADPTTSRRIVTPAAEKTECRRGSVHFDSLEGSMSGQNFAAVLFGDCTASWRPQTLPQGPAAAGPSDAAVRIGSPWGPYQNRVRLPLLVSAATPYSALLLELGYDGGQLRLLTVRPRGGRYSRLVRARTAPDGRATIALASLRPIHPERPLTLLLDFETAASMPPLSSVSVRSLQLDEGPAFAGTAAVSERSRSHVSGVGRRAPQP